MAVETTDPDQPARAPGLSRRAKIISWVVVVALLVVALVWITGVAGSAGGKQAAERKRRDDRVQTVGVAQAARQDVPVTIEALGTVTPTETVTVRPQVSGTISAILFREGQMVKQGQVLARIDPRPYRAQLEQTQGTLARDQAQLNNARLTLQRYRTLLSQDSIARQEVDTQAALVKQLEGSATTDQGAVAAARLNVGFADIRAPVSGRVGLRVTDLGNYIGAGDANGVAVLTTVAPIDVAFSIPQDQVPVIERAARARSLAADALDRTRDAVLAHGRFLTLDNQIATDTGTVRGKARFANGNGALFPNQFVNLRLLVDTLRDAVTVPVTAVRQSENSNFVWLLKPDNTVTQRNIVTGETVGTAMVVSRGLSAGDKVVSEGGDRVKEGDKVQTPEAATRAAKEHLQGGHGHRAH